MHDRLVSRRIDALHQCFLVNSLYMEQLVCEAAYVMDMDMGLCQVRRAFCIASEQGMVHGAPIIQRNFRCRMFILLKDGGMLSLTLPLFLVKLYRLYFDFLWNYLAHCSIFENGILLLYTLECVSSVANFITAYEESQ